MTLYNMRHAGDQYRCTKFDRHFNVESSYLCTLSECECPAGHRPHCRHREMLPKFIQRGHIGDEWMYDHDRGGWVQTEMPEDAELFDPVKLDDHLEAIAKLGVADPVILAEPSLHPVFDLPQYHGVPIKEVERIEPTPTPKPPQIRRRV